MSVRPRTLFALAALASLVCLPKASLPAGDVPRELRPWLGPQKWQRDTDGPIVSLGEPGAFDDTHIFAPAVVREDDRFLLWYCGSQGTVAERVFRLGLATGRDGRRFEKYGHGAVLEFDDGKHSILTPALLRDADGRVRREEGKLRMWFSSTWFRGASGLHTLHETSSGDGVHWSAPSPALLENVYAPTIINTGRFYQMWYTDVATDPWVIRHASSTDGRRWRKTTEAVLELDQDWERTRLFYPTVRRIDGAYLMWYGSYWSARANTTALGFAVSLDGTRWYRHPLNPVLRPDPNRPWESHYVTSQSVLRLADGSFRIWYASRKRPPFLNKYFAINTARWSSGSDVGQRRTAPLRFRSADELLAWRRETRKRLRGMLGIPDGRVPLDPEKRGQSARDGIVIERWVFTSEPGSRVPAVLYRPQSTRGTMPVIVLTFGHGGSKSQWQYNYAGLVYAKLGLACLALDPLGEEERHARGRLGTRAHDSESVHDRADRVGRLIMGKLVFDTMRGIDFLMERDDIDHERIGVAGNSLGGAQASWMAALEPRLRMAIVSGWAYDDIVLRTKHCTKVPGQRMRELCTWSEYASLGAPECAVLVMNGDADRVIDREDDGSAWSGTRSAVDEASRAYELVGAPERIRVWFEKGGGHRPYFVYKEALEWIHRHLGTPGWTLERIRALATLNSGEWCDAEGVRLERLYGTPLHQRGATLPDLGLRRTPRRALTCLTAGERGSPEFTVEGWLRSLQRDG